MFMVTSLITPKEIIGPAPLSILQRPVNEGCFVKPTRHSQRLIPLLQQWFKLPRIVINVFRICFFVFPHHVRGKGYELHWASIVSEHVVRQFQMLWGSKFRIPRDTQEARHEDWDGKHWFRFLCDHVFVGHNSYLWDSILYFFSYFSLIIICRKIETKNVFPRVICWLFNCHWRILGRNGNFLTLRSQAWSLVYQAQNIVLAYAWFPSWLDTRDAPAEHCIMAPAEKLLQRPGPSELQMDGKTL